MKLLVLGACCLLLVSGSVQAGIITTYDFKGAAGSQLSTAASNVAAGLVAGAIARGSGVTATSGANSINSSAWTTAGSLDANDYYTFSLTPQSGFQMTLGSLVFSELRSGTGPTTAALRSSLDGFSSDIMTFTTSTTAASHTVTFGGTFAGLTSGVELRLFGYSASSSAGTLRITNTGSTFDTPGVTVDGTVSAFAAVPEPSTLALLATGIATLFLFVLRAHFVRLRRPFMLQGHGS